jgi:DNA polymerase-3 subunit gamma/tau
LLICKDERVAGLLEAVEAFKQRYVEMAERIETGYLISVLNILNEAEINFKAARNKRLHVELTLIKLCYLQQALQLTASGSALDKKKVVDTNKAVAFKNIAPIAVKTAPAKTEIQVPKPTPSVEPKLIIETKPEPKPVVQETKPAYMANNGAARNGSKLSLDVLRKKAEAEANSVAAIDHPIQLETLTAAWKKFIQQLKDEKNPAAQSFEMAILNVTDANSFSATVHNNINQKFIELERNKACAFLQKELHNKQLQLTIILEETEEAVLPKDLPLSSKEQYQKIIEQFPMVKELRERLRLELDY